MDNHPTLINGLLIIFNPIRSSLAAKFWQTGDQKGFSPVCGNKFHKRMCGISKGVKNPCDGCSGQDYKPLTAAMFNEHLNGKKRFGVYPLGQDGAVAWTAADLDNHNGRSAPDVDLQKILEVCRLFDVPVLVFSSTSGNGFHVYLFFKKPIPAWKARGFS